MCIFGRKMQKSGDEHTADWVATMNGLGSRKKPFLFILDYELMNPLILPLDEVDSEQITFDVRGFSNFKTSTSPDRVNLVPKLERFPVSFEDYSTMYDEVLRELHYGNSFLVNLTCKTEINTNLDLREIFERSSAKYKLYLRDKFVLFSPETFIVIRKGRISTFPMKGTIDASVDQAHWRIIENTKEKAEHITIVDLLRNDLSRVAMNVRVDRFRFIEEVRTHAATLLQVSSEISGDLPDNYEAKLGSILAKLLPAGSISGAPKRKTVEILKRIEAEPRGYFTGVFGYFDGTDLDSGVMIRFIEKQKDRLFFRSGGGITAMSVVHDEYKEMIDKVYVPVY